MRSNSREPLITQSSRSNRSYGFTLIELMVVLVILTISLGLIIPRVGAGWRRLEDRDFLQEFVNTLRSGRLFAMNSGEVVIFRIRSSERVYGLGEPDKPIPTTVDIFADRLEVDPETKDSLIIFFPDGSLSGSNLEVVFDQVRTYRVSINPIFGAIQCSRVEAR